MEWALAICICIIVVLIIKLYLVKKTAREIRIEFAKNILKTTKTPIKEIAEYLRFSSEYHFSGSFKKKVGISPREYRKQQSESGKADHDA